MEKKRWAKPIWQTLLSVCAISIGIIGISSPSEASVTSSSSKEDVAETTSSNLQLAQVGVRSRINAPTSINITPPRGSHIPLPVNSYYHHNRRYHSYPRRSRQNYYYRGSRGYGRRKPCYGDHYYHDAHYRHGTVRKRYPHRRSRRVIIIKGSY